MPFRAGFAALVVTEAVANEGVGRGEGKVARGVVVQALVQPPRGRVPLGEPNVEPPRLAQHPSHPSDMAGFLVLSLVRHHTPHGV